MIPEETPERIFLCLGDEDPEPSKFSDHTDVSWSADQSVNWTVPYVREDLVQNHLDRPDSPGLWLTWLLDWDKDGNPDREWFFEGVLRVVFDHKANELAIIRDGEKKLLSELEEVRRYLKVVGPPAPPMPEEVKE